MDNESNIQNKAWGGAADIYKKPVLHGWWVKKKKVWGEATDESMLI